MSENLENREPEQQPGQNENIHEILEKGREVMRSSFVKEMSKKLRELKRERGTLEEELNFYKTANFRNFDKDQKEVINQTIEEIEKILVRNESELALLEADIQGIEDAVKEEMVEDLKKVKNKK